MKNAEQSGTSKRFDPLRVFVVSLVAAIAMRICWDGLQPFGSCVYPKTKVAEAELGQFKTDIDLFEAENGHYPGTNGLNDLVIQPSDASPEWHQYLDKVPLDPWGLPYRYEYPGRHNINGYDLSSAGPDGKFGTRDDIGNWDELKR